MIYSSGALNAGKYSVLLSKNTNLYAYKSDANRTFTLFHENVNNSLKPLNIREPVHEAKECYGSDQGGVEKDRKETAAHGLTC